MTVRFFHYQDSSAPQLSKAAGSLSNLLSACLVGTGGLAYGTKPAIGGWTVAFQTGNNIAFRTAVGTSQYYYRFDDTGPGAGGVAEARFHAFRTMSSLTSGTGQFPAATIGSVIRKSGSDNRPWWLVGDERTFYLYVQWYPSGSIYSDIYCFGEIDSFIPTDTYNVICCGRNTENNSVSLASTFQMDVTGAGNTRRLVARNGFTSTGENNIFCSSCKSQVENEIGAPNLDYPGTSGGILLRPVYWVEGVAPSQELRGIARGVYHHTYKPATLPNATLLTGVANYPGRTFRVSESNGHAGVARPIFDLTGPW